MGGFVLLDGLELFDRHLAGWKSSGDKVGILEFGKRRLVELPLELLEDVGKL
jgi:hypothetical protein